MSSLEILDLYHDMFYFIFFLLKEIQFIKRYTLIEKDLISFVSFHLMVIQSSYQLVNIVLW